MTITHHLVPSHPHGQTETGNHANCEQPVLTSTGCFI